jgi:hypothetical protein
MEILVHNIMMLSQMVAVCTTPKTSLLPENAAYVVVVKFKFTGCMKRHTLFMLAKEIFQMPSSILNLS